MEKIDLNSDSSMQKDVSLKQIIEIIWDRKVLIISISCALSLFSIIYSLSLNDIYTAEAILAPTEDTLSNNNNLIGLADLAGFNLGSDSVDKVTLGIETIKSLSFFKTFIANNNVLVHLLASRRWDENTQKVIIDNSIYNESSGEWNLPDNELQNGEPNIQQAYEKFRKLISVSKDFQTGLIILKVDHISPLVAKNWNDWIIRDINKLSQSLEISRSEKAIGHLNEQINLSTYNNARELMFRILETELHNIMIAKTTPDYLFNTIDPAVVSYKKSKPFRSIIVLSFTFFGFLASSLGVLIHRLYFKED